MKSLLETDSDKEFFEKEYKNAGEINFEIERLEKQEPDGRTKEYSPWVKKMNHLFVLYNKSTNFAAYKIIK